MHDHRRQLCYCCCHCVVSPNMPYGLLELNSHPIFLTSSCASRLSSRFFSSLSTCLRFLCRFCLLMWVRVSVCVLSSFCTVFSLFISSSLPGWMHRLMCAFTCWTWSPFSVDLLLFFFFSFSSFLQWKINGLRTSWSCSRLVWQNANAETCSCHFCLSCWLVRCWNTWYRSEPINNFLCLQFNWKNQHFFDAISFNFYSTRFTLIACVIYYVKIWSSSPVFLCDFKAPNNISVAIDNQIRKQNIYTFTFDRWMRTKWEFLAHWQSTSNRFRHSTEILLNGWDDYF